MTCLGTGASSAAQLSLIHTRPGTAVFLPAIVMNAFFTLPTKNSATTFETWLSLSRRRAPACGLERSNLIFQDLDLHQSRLVQFFEVVLHLLL